MTNDIRVMSDEVNKALVQELTTLVEQAHSVTKQLDTSDSVKQALFSFGNFIAARAMLRLEAVSDKEWLENAADLKEELQRLTAIHNSSFVPVVDAEAAKDEASV
jgi:hypothetical protein